MDLDDFDFNECHGYLMEYISKYKVSEDPIICLSGISHFISINHEVTCPDDLNRKTRLVYNVLRGHDAKN